MKSQVLLVLLTLTLVVVCSCVKEKKPPYEPPQNMKQLLSGDSMKTWKIAKRYNGKTRMNMGDCFLGYRQVFSSDGTVTDNNNKLADCGKSLSGNWRIIKDSLGITYIRIQSPHIPELMDIEEDFKDFKIFYFSEDSLHLSFEHKQFGEKRRISDYLVRDDIKVIGRDFHY